MDKIVETKNHCVPPGGRLPAWCRHYAAVARCWCWVCPIGESHRAALCPLWCGGGPGGAEQRSRLRCQSSVVPEPETGPGSLPSTSDQW